MTDNNNSNLVIAQTEYPDDALVLPPYIFTTATLDDAEQLLKIINDCYVVSEGAIWKEGTFRTNIDDVKAIVTKEGAARAADMYLIMKKRDTGEIIASMRYEPKLFAVNCTACNGAEGKTCCGSSEDKIQCKDSGIVDIDTFRPDGETDIVYPSYKKSLTQYTELDIASLFNDDLLTMFINNEVFNPFDSTALKFANVDAVVEKLNSLTQKQICLYSLGYFSQFCTNSEYQGKGYATILLNFVQNYTKFLKQTLVDLFQRNADAVSGYVVNAESSKAVMTMVVLNCRFDMIRFYTKRNYKLTTILPPEPHFNGQANEKFFNGLWLKKYELEVE